MEEVLGKLRKFKKSQELNLSDDVKIIDISYYGKINLSKNDADLSNGTQEDLYLLKKEVNGKTELEFHTNKGLIATIGEGGIILISNEYKDLISDKEFLVQMQKVMPISLEKLEQIKNRNKESQNQTETMVNETSSLKEDDNRQYIPNAKDIKIDMNKKITETKAFSDLVPEVKDKGIKDVIVRRKDGVNFEFIGINENNEEIPLQTLGQTEGTNPNQDIVEVNQDGSEVKKDQVLTMLKIRTGENQGREDEGFTVSLGEYGIPEVNYYRRASQTDEYTSIPVNLENTNQKRTELDVREFMEKKRNTNVNDNIEKANDRIEENESEETVIQNIDDDYSNDTIDDSEILIEEAAKRCKISVEAFKQEMENVDGESLEEKIENTEEEINEQFIGNNERKR